MARRLNSKFNFEVLPGSNESYQNWLEGFFFNFMKDSRCFLENPSENQEGISDIFSFTYKFFMGKSGEAKFKETYLPKLKENIAETFPLGEVELTYESAWTDEVGTKENSAASTSIETPKLRVNPHVDDESLHAVQDEESNDDSLPSRFGDG
jgi:hypothetical protein